MKKYSLIEKEVKNRTDVLPIFYKKLQFNLSIEKADYFNSSTLYTKSDRHQTCNLVSTRFYKQITFFNF